MVVVKLALWQVFKYVCLHRFEFLKYGSTLPLLFIFLCKAFYKNDLQTGIQ